MTCEAIGRHRKCRQGELLDRALQGINVEGIVRTAEDAVSAILRHDIDTVAGVPVQVRSVLEHEDVASIPYGKIKSTVITSDRVHPVLAGQLERKWGCRVFYHYGTTETGLAGGVECQAREGYHLRETDLYFEVVDPSSGKSLPPGEPGEIVFTTLTRKGMPLIRYRTGDLSQFLPEPCRCGSELRRLERVQGRLEENREDSKSALGSCCLTT
jgi:phenylacetate-CoA ligase